MGKLTYSVIRMARDKNSYDILETHDTYEEAFEARKKYDEELMIGGEKPDSYSEVE
jgi:hypothetical protein